jgi:RNA recognition motif-containing protein
MGTRLFVTNLSIDTSVRELQDLFQEAGPVRSIRIAVNHLTGANKEWGFVEMESPEMAQAAALQINGRLLHDRTIRVIEISPR